MSKPFIFRQTEKNIYFLAHFFEVFIESPMNLDEIVGVVAGKESGGGEKAFQQERKFTHSTFRCLGGEGSLVNLLQQGTARAI